jgi:hypothetical protein
MRLKQEATIPQLKIKKDSQRLTPTRTITRLDGTCSNNTATGRVSQQHQHRCTHHQALHEILEELYMLDYLMASMAVKQL